MTIAITTADLYTHGTDLTPIQQEVKEVNVANGWYDAERDFETGIALIHTEISEMFDAYRDHLFADATDRKCQIKFEDQPEHLCKPEGVGAEAADIFIRLIDEASRQGAALTVSSIHASEGFDGSFSRFTNRLHALTTKWEERGLKAAETGIRSLVAQNHEAGAGAIYGALLRGCHEFEIDLMPEYTRKIAYNATRGHMHGGKHV
jgi:hypothetical protein